MPSYETEANLKRLLQQSCTNMPLDFALTSFHADPAYCYRGRATEVGLMCRLIAVAEPSLDQERMMLVYAGHKKIS